MEAVFGAVGSLGGVAIGAAASLVGVAVGVAATYFGQVRQWKRTTRFEGYRRFAGGCKLALDCLLDVRHALVRDLSATEINDAWQRANAEVRNVRRLFGEMEAGPGPRWRSNARRSFEKTGKAAKELETYLIDMSEELFNLHQSR
jgi:hypothetical protein